MFTTTLKSLRFFAVLTIVAGLAIFITSAGALAQKPDQWPPRVPHDREESDISITSINPASATGLALAMGVPSSDLLAADLMGSDPNGVGVGNTPLGSWFPTEGTTYAILSTGLAADAALPNTEENHSTELDGLDSDKGEDLVRLHLQLKVPNDINCASFDFAFYSEEFPEFVGSIFNDTFTAQLNNSSLSTTQDYEVIAPGNFAFDTQDNVISVNTVFGVLPATSTTYDGVTPILRAQTAVVPGATIDMYLSIQDLGDSIYDSSVFLDKFFWSKAPDCSDGALADTDGDGLLDDWETDGLTVSSAGVNEFVDLPAMGADPKHKDVFVEIDYMVGGGHSHQPTAAGIANIVDAFDNAPVTNPDGTTGIHLHVDYGATAPLTWGTDATWGALSNAEALPHQTNLGTCTGFYNWDAFDVIKQDHLTAGRAAVFHYNIWAHNLCSSFGSTSGISRNGTLFGNGASDFIVSLGGWTNSVGTPNEQGGTFMHELGHNLGLRHGGGDHENWKPNYLSVMSYAFQTRGLFIGGTSGHFDYSRYSLPNLVETNLNETTGINVSSSLGTYHFCGSTMTPDTDASAVDWNCDGDETDTGVSYNVNNSNGLGTLTTQNDWINLVYSGGAISQPGADVELPSQTEVIDIDATQDAQIPSFPTKTYVPLIIR
ncbi:MAG: choice-of-anchor L domain-containing protein [Anaerolineae bacterium]|nr:choice-of-anchor L domain-containing protein [Anaerolineae bacterium]